MEEYLTIAATAALCGLAESTLRYWERIGLVSAVERDASSGHRRYRLVEVELLETLSNLRAAGLSIEDMRTYLANRSRGGDIAGEQRALFETHARRLADEMETLERRRTYLETKVRYWAALESGDLDKAAAIAEELSGAQPLRHSAPRRLDLKEHL